MIYYPKARFTTFSKFPTYAIESLVDKKVLKDKTNIVTNCPKCERLSIGLQCNYCEEGLDNPSTSLELYHFQKGKLKRISAVEETVKHTHLRIASKNQKLPDKYKHYRQLQRCNNSYFDHLDIFIFKSDTKIGISSERIEIQPSKMYNDRGIESAKLYIHEHTHNSLPYADGLINLKSELVSKRNKISIYTATWIREGRVLFTEYALQSGWIAKQGSRTFHSTISAEDARNGLIQKRKLLPSNPIHEQRAEQALKRAEKSKRSMAAYQGHQNKILNDFRKLIPKNLLITKKQARDSGMCEPGTNDFIQRHGLDSKAEVPVLEIFDLEPKNSHVLGYIYMKTRGLSRKAFKQMQKMREKLQGYI